MTANAKALTPVLAVELGEGIYQARHRRLATRGRASPEVGRTRGGARMNLYTKIAMSIAITLFVLGVLANIAIEARECLKRGGVPVLYPTGAMCAARLP